MNAFVNNTTQAHIFQEWLDAKRTEDTAKAKRLEIEAQIVQMVGVKDEGVTAYEDDAFKIKTTGKVTRSVDTGAVQSAWEVLPDEVKKCFKWSASLDTKEYRALCSMRNDLIPQLNQYITSKPSKPSISVELKESE